MNHKYDIDWLAGWMICQRLGIMQVCKEPRSISVRRRDHHRSGLENRRQTIVEIGPHCWLVLDLHGIDFPSTCLGK